MIPELIIEIIEQTFECGNCHTYAYFVLFFVYHKTCFFELKFIKIFLFRKHSALLDVKR